MPELSIIIPHFNSKGLLLKCLASLPQDMDVEVIVVDDFSFDNTIRKAKNLFPGVRFIFNNANMGFAKTCNRGALHARGDFLLFLNQDTVLKKDGIKKCLDFIKKDRKIGVVGPLIYNSDGSIQWTLRRYPTIPMLFFGRNSFITKIFPHNKLSRYYLYRDLDISKPHKVESVSGAFFLVRKEVFTKLNGFDEDFFMYVEDMDFCLRTKKAGWEVWYIPVPAVTHILGENVYKKNRKKAKMHHFISFYKFFTKHKIHSSFARFIFKILIGFRLIVLFAFK